jgi:hypothetical protein
MIKVERVIAQNASTALVACNLSEMLLGVSPWLQRRRISNRNRPFEGGHQPENNEHW